MKLNSYVCEAGHGLLSRNEETECKAYVHGVACDAALHEGYFPGYTVSRRKLREQWDRALDRITKAEQKLAESTPSDQGKQEASGTPEYVDIELCSEGGCPKPKRPRGTVCEAHAKAAYRAKRKATRGVVS